MERIAKQFWSSGHAVKVKQMQPEIFEASALLCIFCQKDPTGSGDTNTTGNEGELILFLFFTALNTNSGRPCPGPKL